MTKVYLATQQEVQTVAGNVTNINTQLNDASVGLIPRVTALEAASAGSGGPAFGDTKFSYKTVAHDGWVPLHGQARSSLTPTQQAVSDALGFGLNIPDTRDYFPIAASASKPSGSLGGNNLLFQSTLPNVTLNGTTGINNVGHTHTTAAYNINETTTGEYATDSTNTNVIAFSNARTIVSDNGAALGGTTDNSYLALAGADRPIANSNTLHTHPITINIPTTTSGTQSANHTHTFTTSSINGGVAQTAHIPRYSAKTEFVFLGL